MSIKAIENGLSFNFEGTRILDSEINCTKRKIKESLCILKNLDDCVNFKIDSENISDCYSLIVSMLSNVVFMDWLVVERCFRGERLNVL